jgi:hypothetical protein
MPGDAFAVHATGGPERLLVFPSIAARMQTLPRSILRRSIVETGQYLRYYRRGSSQ